jgi:ABC-type phosphate transport system substrate-binding protein
MSMLSRRRATAMPGSSPVRNLMIVAMVGAILTTFAGGVAAADPPSGATTAGRDVVGVGGDSMEWLMDQFSHDYNASHPTGARLYSWDATNPNTGAIGDSITTKSGCSGIARPDGSNAGITALIGNVRVGHHFCVDFSTSVRPRVSTDPPRGTGGIVFVSLADDAVTWSTQATTNAPTSLTTAQLAAIYNCSVTNWSQVGGSNGLIQAFIPQSGSGERTFFLQAIGVTAPGSCVSTLQQDEGVDSELQGPNVIFPYSVAKYVAERYHSAQCFNSACFPVNNAICSAGTNATNLFGCDTHGTLILRSINGIQPIVNRKINPIYPLILPVFDVVRYDNTTSSNMPAYLMRWFGAGGWLCTHKSAQTALRDYGFLPISDCGSSS